jgi:hypothetical protein
MSDAAAAAPQPPAPAPTLQSAAPPAINPADVRLEADWAYDRPLIACRFDPTGQFAFSSAEDNKLQRWNRSSGEKVSVPGHESWIWAIGFSPEGATTYTGAGDGRVLYWPTAAPELKPTRTIDAHHGWVRCLAASHDGKLLATGGNDRTVKIWNAADGALVRAMPPAEVPIYSVLFHASGQFLLSGDLRGNVVQWDVNTGASVRTFDAKQLFSYNGGQGVDFGGVRSMALSPDGKYLACAGLFNASNPLGAVLDPLVLLFEWESQKLVQSHIADGLKGPIWRVVYHPAGHLIGVCGGSTGGHVLFWKPDQNKEFHRYALPSLARDMDLDRAGTHLLTAHYDQHLRTSTLLPKSA